LLSLLRFALPNVHLTLGLHETLFACLADGQMVKKTNGELCHKAEPELCSLCFPHITSDTFMARQRYNKDSLEIADTYIVPAKHLGGVLQREMGVNARQIYVINHPIDLERYPSEPPDHRRNKPVRFGFFGQFVDNKGIHILLKAGDLVNRSQPSRAFQIVINGGNKKFASEDYRKKVNEMIDKSHQWEHGEVVEMGGYTHDDLLQRMAGVDVVVVPSTWPEVYGLVVTEAFACYKPVIASYIGGLAERVKHGVDGFNFVARNAADLATKMELFLEMEETRYLEMAEAAYTTASLLHPKRALESYFKALALKS
jgi:glycosyltransferase involved in cell wall biosynthesis